MAKLRLCVECGKNKTTSNSEVCKECRKEAPNNYQRWCDIIMGDKVKKAEKK